MFDAKWRPDMVKGDTQLIGKFRCLSRWSRPVPVALVLVSR